MNKSSHTPHWLNLALSGRIKIRTLPCSQGVARADVHCRSQGAVTCENNEKRDKESTHTSHVHENQREHARRHDASIQDTDRQTHLRASTAHHTRSENRDAVSPHSQNDSHGWSVQVHSCRAGAHTTDNCVMSKRAEASSHRVDTMEDRSSLDDTYTQSSRRLTDRSAHKHSNLVNQSAHKNTNHTNRFSNPLSALNISGHTKHSPSTAHTLFSARALSPPQSVLPVGSGPKSSITSPPQHLHHVHHGGSPVPKNVSNGSPVPKNVSNGSPAPKNGSSIPAKGSSMPVVIGADALVAPVEYDQRASAPDVIAANALPEYDQRASTSFSASCRSNLSPGTHVHKDAHRNVMDDGNGLDGMRTESESFVALKSSDTLQDGGWS
jgi:hypothetical protein